MTNALMLHDEGYFTEIGYDYNKMIQPLVEHIKGGSNYASKEEALKDKAP